MTDTNNKNQAAALPSSLTWQAPAFHQHQRSFAWYVGLALIGAGLIAFAVYDRSLITGITFGLMILVVFLVARQPVRDVTYRITPTGLTIGTLPYDYKVIKNFWILYYPPQIKTLNFETTAYVNNKISMQLGDQDPVLIKRVLTQYLPEDLNREESLTDALARRLKI